jgi:hypothetical protein
LRANLGPLAFQLANGVECIFGDGASPSIGNTILFYVCEPSGQGFTAPGEGNAGAFNRSGQPWTVEYAKNLQAGMLTQEILVKAWY